MKNPFVLFFQGFFSGFKRFGFLVAEVFNSIFLSIAYFVGVGIVAIFFKITGKHLLDFGNKKKPSYWMDKKVEMETEYQYYKQY